MEVEEEGKRLDDIVLEPLLEDVPVGVDTGAEDAILKEKDGLTVFATLGYCEVDEEDEDAFPPVAPEVAPLLPVFVCCR